VAGVAVELWSRRRTHLLVRHPRLIPLDLAARVLIGVIFACSLSLAFNTYAAVYHSPWRPWAPVAFCLVLGTLIASLAPLMYAWVDKRHKLERQDEEQLSL
jgi:hypothetical protein